VASPDDHLLDSPDRDLLREVTGVEPDRSGKHAILPKGERRTTQRVGLGSVGDGIAVFTWPAELVSQAKRLYDGMRAPRLLAAADDGRWKVELRPHLAYWRSRPGERFYMHPKPTLTPALYASRWASADAGMIGGHDRMTVRTELWPWLLERGYASAQDTDLLEPFLERVNKANRDVHLRPGLALIRRWSREDANELRSRRRLAAEIRVALSHILLAVDDPPLPAALS
jgi:O-acetyl-ADP-ribose deacetylase